ncbi:MAG: pyridoxamine 5'-phosphate oxidase family protein [Deltaproteobacteria bacterium]|nr:pyridoxamine 5'-phosphate oxidase family protein [Deltaproteobacteria bacterium]
MTRDELEKIVIAFMDSSTTMILACSLDDEPWSVPVYYARRAFDLIFFSSRESLHSQIFSKNPTAAASICGDYKRWQDIKGLQMNGTVQILTKLSAVTRAASTYFKRYPFARDLFSNSGFLSTGLSKKTKVALYFFCIKSIRYLDNSYGFGVRWKIDIQDGRVIGSPILS